MACHIPQSFRIVRHGRYVIFQRAEVAVPRALFAGILERIDRLRGRPCRRRDQGRLLHGGSRGESQAPRADERPQLRVIDLLYATRKIPLTSLAALLLLGTALTSLVWQPGEALADVSSGLVGHWTLDDADLNWTNGTAEVRDRSGRGHHGNALGSLSSSSVVSGRVGKALSFNGSSDRIAVSNLGMSGVGTATIAAWVKVDEGKTSCTNLPTVMASGASHQNGLYLRDGCNAVGFKGASGSNSAGVLVTLSGFNHHGWNHLAGVSDNSGMYLYVNGVRVGSNTSSFTKINITGGYEIGHTPGYSGRFFDGLIDDVRIYNRALSASEIKELAAGDTPGDIPGVASGVTPCANPKTYNVTPSNIGSTIRSLSSCSVLNLAPGTYGNSTIRGKEGVTVRCTDPRRCFVKRLQLQDIGTAIVEDTYFNGVALAEGGTSDYGIISYDVDNIRIVNNHFQGRLNHDMSIRENTKYGEILNNTFIKSRRHCIEVGQTPNTVDRSSVSGKVIIMGNLFDDPQYHCITQRSNRHLIVQNNEFRNVGGSYNLVWTSPWNSSLTLATQPNSIYIMPAPHRTEVLNNTLSGTNRRMCFPSRGIADDTVLVKGNGSVSCVRANMDSGTRNAYANEQTTAAPRLDSASDVFCPIQ